MKQANTFLHTMYSIKAHLLGPRLTEKDQVSFTQGIPIRVHYSKEISATKAVDCWGSRKGPCKLEDTEHDLPCRKPHTFCNCEPTMETLYETCYTV